MSELAGTPVTVASSERQKEALIECAWHQYHNECTDAVDSLSSFTVADCDRCQGALCSHAHIFCSLLLTIAHFVLMFVIVILGGQPFRGLACDSWSETVSDFLYVPASGASTQNPLAWNTFKGGRETCCFTNRTSFHPDERSIPFEHAMPDVRGEQADAQWLSHNPLQACPC